MAKVFSKRIYRLDDFFLLLIPSPQRLSKDFYDQVNIDTTGSWGSIEPNIKATLRCQLKESCDQKGLFVGRDIEPALEWRLYQLQRNRRAELRKVKPG